MKEKALRQQPLFIKFLNNEIDVNSMLESFSRSKDNATVEASKAAFKNPPDLSKFKKEFTEAVEDIITEGFDEGFKAFVNHYMTALEEDVDIKNTPRGENRSQTARVSDKNGPWVQGFICYNLCLYIKAFGLENLKKCRICGRFFIHKGKYAIYCSDVCKKKGQNERKTKKTQQTSGDMPSMPTV